MKEGECAEQLALIPLSPTLLSLLQLQLPSEESPPLFLPIDPPMALLLAKCWVRSSEFQLHELQSFSEDTFDGSTYHRCGHHEMPSVNISYLQGGTLSPALLPAYCPLPHGTVLPLEATSLWNLRVWGKPTNETREHGLLCIFNRVTLPPEEVKMIHWQGVGVGRKSKKSTLFNYKAQIDEHTVYQQYTQRTEDSIPKEGPK